MLFHKILALSVNLLYEAATDSSCSADEKVENFVLGEEE